MPFDDKTNKNTAVPPATPATVESQGAPEIQAQPAADHTQVFLVAGERAFRSADDVVTHVTHAQNHISTLEEERKSDREKLESQTKEIARLKLIEESLVPGHTTDRKPAETPQVSTEQMAAQAATLAVGLLAETKAKELQQSNLADVEALAKQSYGDTYATEVVKIGAAIGMTPEAIDDLGRTSPDAFKKLFIPSSAQAQHQPSRSTVQVSEQQTSPVDKPFNVVKMRERERLTAVAERMRAAGVSGY